MNIYQQDDIPEGEFTVKPPTEQVGPRYIFSPTGNPNDFAIVVFSRPNIIIRILQRLILGFRYYSVK
jgi:hypothetical protein